MARTKISEFSATAADNTDIDNIDIAEGCAPSGINNAIRELMAQLKDMQTGASGDTFTLTTVNSTTVDTTNLEVSNLKAKDGTAAGSIADSTGVVTLTNLTGTTADYTNLEVTNLKAKDGTAAGSIADSTGVVTLNTLSTGGGVISPQTGFKNRIINGAMTIDQRNAGAAVTASGAFAVDRFISPQFVGYATLALSAQQSTDTAPNFTQALKTTVVTAQAVPTGGYIIGADHRIEGFNFADFGFGTANAQPFTLSFWVKSSITGTYPVSFFNAAVNRAYLATYTINAANTWEKKTITVAGDTSGTWNTTNDIGLGMQFAIAAASGSHGTPGSWSGTYKSGVSGMPDVGATSGATWAVTGVQLERGSTATPFEFRSYGQELALCQRYYQTGLCAYSGYQTAGSSYGGFTPFATTMRAAPTMVFTDTLNTNTNVGTSTANIGVLVAGTGAETTIVSTGGFRFARSFTASIEL